MADKLYSIRELVAPIIGGYWGQTSEDGTGNARVVRNGDVQDSGCIGPKVPLRLLSEKEIAKAQLLPGDTVITMSGNVGRAAFIKEACDAQDIPYVASNFIKILRPDESKVLARYLFYTLQTPAFAAALRKHTRGVAIQNLSTKVFDQPIIPLPSLKEQQRIVTLLDEAEELKAKRAVANQKMASVTQALFIEMFGDPIQNEKGWSKAELSTFTRVVTGNTPPRANLAFYGGETEWIKSDNILDARMYPSTAREYLSAEGTRKGRTTGAGSILMTCIAGSLGSIGNVCITDRAVAFNQQINAIEIQDDTDPIFLYALLKSSKSHLHKSASQALKHLINKSSLERVEVIRPPVNLQREFAEAIKALETISEKQKESAVQIDGLYSSLLSKAFV